MEKLAKGTGDVLAVTGDEELLKSLREANALLEQVAIGQCRGGLRHGSCDGKQQALL